MTQQANLRLWPGVVIVSIQWLGRYVIPVFVPAALPAGAIGGIAAGLLIVVWWLLFSRAAWSERVGAVVLMVVALIAASQFLHVSMATAGMGFLYPMYAVPLLSLAFVVWAVATRNLSDGARRVSMVATILLTCSLWTTLRTGGVTGDFQSDFAWRWSETPEELLLARGEDELTTTPPTTADVEADWPGFRGPARDGVIAGVRIETDWSASPPIELWRRPIGPGWSSFAVLDDLVYTQEQRGEDEIVASYRLSSGEPVWRHRDPARFWESNGGAGPRGTPTLRDGRVYTFGATGILNALDAVNGSVIWSRDVGADADVKVPGWGFASSPLVVGDVVIVAASGRLVAYELPTGEPRWLGPKNGSGYSSPHRLTIDSVEQIVLMTSSGATSVRPSDGTVLWEHAWKEGTTRIVQPALTAEGDLLISGGEARGMRRIAVTRGPDGWAAEERWTSIRLKPYFNDFVVHDGYAYGFDGRILACIDVEDGAREWKGGRYGHGQLVLLADQDVLLVLTEQGELALVDARPEKFTELARVPAIEGKTWNHPVLVRDVLLARNGEEMVAFRLSLSGASRASLTP